MKQAHDVHSQGRLRPVTHMHTCRTCIHIIHTHTHTTHAHAHMLTHTTHAHARTAHVYARTRTHTTRAHTRSRTRTHVPCTHSRPPSPAGFSPVSCPVPVSQVTQTLQPRHIGASSPAGLPGQGQVLPGLSPQLQPFPAAGVSCLHSGRVVGVTSCLCPVCPSALSAQWRAHQTARDSLPVSQLWSHCLPHCMACKGPRSRVWA